MFRYLLFFALYLLYIRSMKILYSTKYWRALLSINNIPEEIATGPVLILLD